MAAPVTGLPGVAGAAAVATLDPARGAARAAGVGGPDFASALGDALDAAGNAERAADQANVQFASGDGSLAIDEVMIAAEKASISLRYVVALKNHALEAYRELMNTQV